MAASMGLGSRLPLSNKKGAPHEKDPANAPPIDDCGYSGSRRGSASAEIDPSSPTAKGTVTLNVAFRRSSSASRRRLTSRFWSGLSVTTRMSEVCRSRTNLVSKVLVLKRDKIGDMLLTTPLLAHLKAALPQVETHLLANDYNAWVVAGDPHVDRVWTYRRVRNAGRVSLRAAWLPGAPLPRASRQGSLKGARPSHRRVRWTRPTGSCTHQASP